MLTLKLRVETITISQAAIERFTALPSMNWEIFQFVIATVSQS